MRRTYFLAIALLLCSLAAFAQHHAGHSRRGLGHKTRLIADKQYLTGEDTSQFSMEVFFANFNNWTGDNYGYLPSVQGLATWDNNRNTSVGVFGCLNYRGSHSGGLYSNGADMFFSRTLSKKWMVIVDAYAYFNKKDSLRDYFGYKASFYNLYSGRLRYDLNKRFAVIAGYSLMNSRDSTLQSVSLELDYNITGSLVVLVSYSSGADLLDFSQGSVNGAVGLVFSVKNFDFSLTFSPWLNAQPPTYYGMTAYSPFLFSVSTDLVKHARKKARPH